VRGADLGGGWCDPLGPHHRVDEPVGGSVDIDLSGRTALVTGAATDIGKAIGRALLHAGAAVVAQDLDRTEVGLVVDELSAFDDGAEISGVAADLGTAAGTAALVAAVPHADVLVNNVAPVSGTSILDVDESEWRRFFDGSVLSNIRLVRHYLPRMVAAGRGRVLFVSGGPLVQTSIQTVHQGVVTLAQLALTRGLAQSVAGTGVTVNAVLPGATLPPVDHVQAPSMESSVAGGSATAGVHGRPIKPGEVANLVLYAVSDYAAATTGATLRVDGGAVPFLVP
jgi:NAD(P)-dependent dehydrogenase (short-subunit alcohol dehydrogenase family)